MKLLPGKRPADLGVHHGQLKAAPSTPNCVSSQATSEYHKIAPLIFVGDGHAAFDRLAKIVASLPLTNLIQYTQNYLHAECSSQLLGFVDDLELYLDTASGVIHVRSASRLGRKDFGVNRKRVETLRAHFAKDGE